jgi:hypothetical protein
MTDKTTGRLAAIACVAAGVLISALPHALALVRTGHAAWIADNDERFYLAVGSQALFNHPGKLADPVVEDGPSLYRPLPLLPGIWAAKLLGLGPLGIGLMWRVLAGASIGLAWYVLLRLMVARPWVAASLALILLSDPGLMEAKPLLRLASWSLQIARGNTAFFNGFPRCHPEWRISTPGTTMAYLIFLIWAIIRARRSPTRGRIALSGLTFGLLFYVYVYYWTGAGLALLIALALDAGHRRVYFHTGWIGGLIGLPAVISDLLMKQGRPDDWLHRTDKFLTIGRFDELILDKWVLAVLALGLVWALIRRRELIFVWALGAAGLLLANHQVLTRLQVENFHWMYVWGPSLSLFLVLSIAFEVGDRTGWSPRARAALGAVAITVFATGLWLRAAEALRTWNPVQTARALADYQAECPPGRSGPFLHNAVVAGETDFVDLAAIIDNMHPLAGYCALLSPSVTDAELDDRTALNGLLRGLDRPAFEAEQRHDFENEPWGPWGRNRDRSLVPGKIASRLGAYDRQRSDLRSALDRFAVRYVALPAGTGAAFYRVNGWDLVADGPTWEVWERTETSRP